MIKGYIEKTIVAAYFPSALCPMTKRCEVLMTLGSRYCYLVCRYMKHLKIKKS